MEGISYLNSQTIGSFFLTSNLTFDSTTSVWRNFQEELEYLQDRCKAYHFPKVTIDHVKTEFNELYIARLSLPRHTGIKIWRGNTVFLALGLDFDINNSKFGKRNIWEPRCEYTCSDLKYSAYIFNSSSDTKQYFCEIVSPPDFLRNDLERRIKSVYDKPSINVWKRIIRSEYTKEETRVFNVEIIKFIPDQDPVDYSEDVCDCDLVKYFPKLKI